MAMDPDRFIALLADRLSAIVPAGFRVTAADGMLRYSAENERAAGRAGSYIRDNIGAYGVGEEAFVGVAVQALDELQDYISEATHTPWPGTSSQPRPHGRIRDGHLDLWYGDRDNVILACDPIPLRR